MNKISHKEMENILNAMKEVTANQGDNPVQSGDKVTLDVKKITSRKGYDRMNPNYRKFVESNKGTVFTARVLTRNSSIEFEEEPTWLFTQQDLIRVDSDADDESRRKKIQKGI